MIDLLRRNRALTGILVLLFLLLVVLTLLNGDKAYPQADLHPENPDPNGARAVARVLEDRGADVFVAHNQSELLGQTLAGDTTVMVTSTTSLGEGTATTLFEQAAAAGTVVVTEPPPGLLPGLLPGLGIGSNSLDGSWEAACDDPLLGGLSVEVRPSPAYRLQDGTGCFGDDGDFLVVRDGSRYVVGGADLFSNHSILDADNAAVALRLLGQHEHVVWYVPDPADLAGSDGTPLASLLPRWLRPALILVGAAAVALVLWRGRRLGPLAVEPLPVVVRNSEAVEARGRLYRKSGDRNHTARALRNGTLERLSAHLGLPPTTGQELMVHEVARITGRPADEVARLLQHHPVGDDAGLVALANALSTLEQPFETLVPQAPLAPQDKEDER